MELEVVRCSAGRWKLIEQHWFSTVSESVVWRHFYYIKSHLTWQQAQSYCRSYYTDLLTIYTKSGESLVNMYDYHSWISLYKVKKNNWKWSNGANFYYDVWAHHEPDKGESCATIYYSSKRFYGNNCENSNFFYCQKKQHPYHYDYTFIPQSKSWLEAQQYCRSEFHDLATFEYVDYWYYPVQWQDFPVWTGLHRDGETWMWSTGVSDYRNWALNETGNNSDCVSISSLGKKMATQNCSDRFPFVCIRESQDQENLGQGNLFLVKENKTWREALEHCQTLESPYDSDMHFELVGLQPEDHDSVMNKVKEADTEVYVVLPPPPLPPAEQHCGVLFKNDMCSVKIADCTEKKNFLCDGSY
ncbi:hypothetical protein F7725_026720 [Dissostichus mawsoni]|uniref:C-type lectin domain-containing protein n=1 Tax=Dissostichus mawsoni TaxID=36200 RepID=A0A7J5X7W8_DISMA|nr:hypothetical protein F7725_026720 [Dissostichus mawsoni]